MARRFNSPPYGKIPVEHWKSLRGASLNFNTMHSFWCNLMSNQASSNSLEKISLDILLSISAYIFVGFEKCNYHNLLSLIIMNFFELNWNLVDQNYAEKNHWGKVNDEFAEFSVLHYFHCSTGNALQIYFPQIHKYKTFCPQIKLFTSRKCKLPH